MITPHRLTELLRKIAAGGDPALKPGELSDVLHELAQLRGPGHDDRTAVFLREARAVTMRDAELAVLQEALWSAALRWQGISTWRPLPLS